MFAEMAGLDSKRLTFPHKSIAEIIEWRTANGDAEYLNQMYTILETHLTENNKTELKEVLISFKECLTLSADKDNNYDMAQFTADFEKGVKASSSSNKCDNAKLKLFGANANNVSKVEPKELTSNVPRIKPSGIP